MEHAARCNRLSVYGIVKALESRGVTMARLPDGTYTVSRGHRSWSGLRGERVLECGLTLADEMDADLCIQPNGAVVDWVGRRVA